VSSARAERYSDLPRSYHRWKWRVLLDIAGGPWPIIFLAMAGIRILAGVIIADLKV